MLIANVLYFSQRIHYLFIKDSFRDALRVVNLRRSSPAYDDIYKILYH